MRDFVPMGRRAKMRPSGVRLSCRSKHFSSLRTTSASMTASSGGGSIAFDKNFSMSPKRRSCKDKRRKYYRKRKRRVWLTLMLNANSCSGVLNISGVKCCSNLSNRAREQSVKQTPGRTRPARPFPAMHTKYNASDLFQ